eukprot:12904936-Prorocentrum_lima.AAC.1
MGLGSWDPANTEGRQQCTETERPAHSHNREDSSTKNKKTEIRAPHKKMYNRHTKKSETHNYLWRVHAEQH